jgi:ligand-binding sensor domain-containing protein
MDRKTGKFQRHTYDPQKPEKLSRPPLIGDPFNMITFITEDKKGGIWIGTTDNGLTYYNPRTEIATRIEAMGDMENEFGRRDAWTICSFL